ncbi:PIN domain-containing protein [Candidatus Pacearchaeota archaeon]|nr:PIN domain-containing protein [Candidatus Pacearchaeota archaeon]
MLIVVDVNVIFSALVNRGNSFEIFEKNKLFRKFEFVSPEFMFSELDSKMTRILNETKLPKRDVLEILSFIKEQIVVVHSSEFADKLQEAFKLNFKDAPYLALALKLKCPIFSGDKGLKKQNRVRIISPRELLDTFESL